MTVNGLRCVQLDLLESPRGFATVHAYVEGIDRKQKVKRLESSEGWIVTAKPWRCAIWLIPECDA